MRNRLAPALAAAIVAMACVQPALAATAIPAGKWTFTFVDAKGRPDKPMQVFTYRPARCDASCTLVFSVHGVNRTASSYRDYWEAAAERYGLVIVAPLFSRGEWPSYSEYDIRREPDREKWAFSVIEHLFDEVAEGRRDYVIFGHSAGGQFVHRMAFFLPDNRARAMVAANAGWYAMPEWRADKAVDSFPYSLAEARVGEDQVRQGLQRRALLLLGDRDTDPYAKDLRRTGQAMKQGAYRLERGQNYFKALTSAANELGVKLGWDLREVPGVAHQGAAMSRYAAEALFSTR